MRIKLVDFWPAAEFRWLGPFAKLLPQMYNVEIVDRDPDFLFFSVFGDEHLNHGGMTKVFYSAEVRGDSKNRQCFSDCDYSFSYHHREDDPNHHRLPNYIMWKGYDNIYQLIQPRNPGKILNNKSKFCNFLYSNPVPEMRKDFFHALSEYEHIDSAGSVLNNMDKDIPQDEDIEWTSKYKFNVSFENCRYEGYTTEKILRAFLAKTIPIYWGNPRVAEDFNPDSFIEVKGKDDFDRAIERVRELNENDDKYKYMISQFPFKDGTIPQQWTEETLRDKFREIFD